MGGWDTWSALGIGRQVGGSGMNDDLEVEALYGWKKSTSELCETDTTTI